MCFSGFTRAVASAWSSRSSGRAETWRGKPRGAGLPGMVGHEGVLRVRLAPWVVVVVVLWLWLRFLGFWIFAMVS